MHRTPIRAALAVAALALLGTGGLAAAQDATPTGEAVAADECTIVQSQIGERLTSLAATPVVPRPVASPVAAADFVPPSGEPADDTTVAAVTQVARELIACTNAGQEIGILLFFTDDLIRSIIGEDIAQLANPLVIQAIAAQTPQSVPPEEQTVFYAVHDVLRLDDDRIGAFITADDLTEPESANDAYFIFVETGDGLRVDDVIDILPEETASTPTP